MAVAVSNSRAHFGKPVEIADRGFGADQHCLLDDRAGHVGVVGLRHQRHAGPGNPGLLERDPAQRLLRHAILRHQQERLVINPQRGDCASCLTVEHIGRIEPPAEANFDYAGIGWFAVEGEEGGGGGDFEEAGREVLARVEHFLEQRGEIAVLDQLSGNADAFVVAHQMRLGRGVDGEALRLEHRAQEGASRAFAVGPGDMEHRWEIALRIAQPVKQRVDRVEPEPPLRQAQRGEAVKLGLYRWGIGGGEVAQLPLRQPCGLPPPHLCFAKMERIKSDRGPLHCHAVQMGRWRARRA